MDLLTLIRAEHSKSNTDRIVDYIGDDKDRFAQLIQLFFMGEYRITQRAAWPLSYCVRRHPDLIRPYFKLLLDNLDRTDIHVAVIRNTVRLLQDVSIPRRFHGRVMSTCFRFVEAPDTPVAVKVFSMTILSQLATEYPEIGPELKLLIDDQWEHATAAFRSRARKVLKQIGRQIEH